MKWRIKSVLGEEEIRKDKEKEAGGIKSVRRRKRR